MPMARECVGRVQVLVETKSRMDPFAAGSLEQGSPTHGPWTDTGLRPVRNRARSRR